MPDPTYHLTLTAAAAADERKAGDIILLNVESISTLADYFVLVTGYSTTQVRAIARAIEDDVFVECDRLPRRVEGLAAASWVLLDYADVIIHVMLPKEREFYDLESFWGQAARLPFPVAG